jgi:hypothetical protein
MKCRICASDCPPGAKLCRDCAAARKRAFAATVTQPLLAAAGAPSVGRPRFAPRPARSRAASKPAGVVAGRSEAVMAASAADAKPTAKKPIGVQWLLLALALACAIIYLIIRVLFAPHDHPTDATTAGEAAGGSAPPAVTEAPAAALAPSTLVAAPAPPAASPAEEASAAAAVALKDANAKARRKINRVEPPSAPPAPAPQAPAPQAVVVAPSAPPPVVEAPRDPWQAMNEGLSRCGREDWIHREACEQQLRLQYCPNHWGVVWQCPIGPTSDR